MHPADLAPSQPVPGMMEWALFDLESKVPLHSRWIDSQSGPILLDPFGPPAVYLPQLPSPPKAVLLTNANHLRHALAWCSFCQIPIAASKDTANELGIEVEVLETTIPSDWQSIPIQGAATGEIAIWVPDLRHLAFGDALIHLPSHPFQFLPDKYCSDPEAMRRSIRSLVDLRPDSISFSHGACLLDSAAEKLAGLPF